MKWDIKEIIGLIAITITVGCGTGLTTNPETGSDSDSIGDEATGTAIDEEVLPSSETVTAVIGDLFGGMGSGEADESITRSVRKSEESGDNGCPLYGDSGDMQFSNTVYASSYGTTENGVTLAEDFTCDASNPETAWQAFSFNRVQEYSCGEGVMDFEAGSGIISTDPNSYLRIHGKFVVNGETIWCDIIFGTGEVGDDMTVGCHDVNSNPLETTDEEESCSVEEEEGDDEEGDSEGDGDWSEEGDEVYEEFEGAYEKE